MPPAPRSTGPPSSRRARAVSTCRPTASSASATGWPVRHGHGRRDAPSASAPPSTRCSGPRSSSPATAGCCSPAASRCTPTPGWPTTPSPDTVLLPGTAFARAGAARRRAGRLRDGRGADPGGAAGPARAGRGRSSRSRSRRADEDGRRAIAIHSRPSEDGPDDEPWIRHASRRPRRRRGTPTARRAADRAWPPAGPSRSTSTDLYERLAEPGSTTAPPSRACTPPGGAASEIFAEVACPRAAGRGRPASASTRPCSTPPCTPLRPRRGATDRPRPRCRSPGAASRLHATGASRAAGPARPRGRGHGLTLADDDRRAGGHGRRAGCGGSADRERPPRRRGSTTRCSGLDWQRIGVRPTTATPGDWRRRRPMARPPGRPDRRPRPRRTRRRPRRSSLRRRSTADRRRGRRRPRGERTTC